MQKRKKVALVIATILMLIIVTTLLAFATARVPEVYADSRLELKKEGISLYKISIRATVSWLTPATIEVQTNGRVIDVTPVSRGCSRLGKNSVTIKVPPTFFHSVRRLEISVMVDLVGEAHCNITVSTFSGPAGIGI